MENQPPTIKNANNRPKIPWIIIFIGNFLQFFSKKLAGKYAFKLFSTPIRYKTPEREQIMAKKAVSEMLFIPKINKKICVYCYGSSTKKVLLVHGWSGRGTQLYKIAYKLLENNYMTISFDAPAHGNSGSKTTLMSEFIDCIFEIEKKYGKFDAIIGHSLGGMAALNALNQGININKAISIGAADLISDIIKNFISQLKLKPIIANDIKNTLDKKFNDNINIYSPSIIGKNIKIPTLVIHDIQDKDVPVKTAYTISKSLKNSTLLITKNLGHRRILRDNFVIKKIIDFIIQ